MSKFYIKSDRIVLEDREIDGFIRIEGDVIAAIEESPSDVDAKILDYTGFTVAPGYVDTHVHGYGGHDIMDGTREGLLEISKGLAKNGVTSFLATTLTDSTEKLNRACENVAVNAKDCAGAKPVGIFLEGPFFTEKFKGAQNPSYMSKPDEGKLRTWKMLSKDMVKKIAIAPEFDNAVEFIKKARAMDVYVALGHSDATVEEAKAAVDAGANIFVHVYNGMSPLHHRSPGMVGAALLCDEAYGEIICDGHHSHPLAAKLVMKAKGFRKTVLITDCMMAGGMANGRYKLGYFDVNVEGGTARLESGSLAGSVLKMCDAVKNVVDWGIASPFEAIQMASLSPAKSVGLDNRIGSIAPGKMADINILNPDMSIRHTFINGILAE